MNYTTLASDDQINKTIQALQENGITATVVANKEEARKTVLEKLPQGGDVMTMTSVTLDETGIAKEINESGKYKPVRDFLYSESADPMEKKRRGAAPEYAVGSVHAVTEDGTVIIASNSGSQLPAYAYGAQHVIWVVSTKKIVKNMDEGMKRIYEHILPLESERAKKAYGAPGSYVSKLLIFHREPSPNRIHMVLVKEDLGY